ncbi:MAG: SDR family oxidoreductase [Planctomycetota bacterium]
MASPVILITGASRGIGAATARLAAARGYHVAFTYHSRESEANEVRRQVEERGQRSLAIQADLSKEEDVLKIWRDATAEFERIDVLVNNVGILEQQTRFEDLDAARLRRIFETNVIGTMLCSREAVRHMSTKHGGKGGAIVNLSSLAAKLGSPNEYVDYAASKAAVDTMTVGLAKEVAEEGIRVNSVRSGSAYTEIHASGGEPDRVDRVAKVVPMRRGAQPEEIAESVLWLASDAASYVTGSILDVAGGQ